MKNSGIYYMIAGSFTLSIMIILINYLPYIDSLIIFTSGSIIVTILSAIFIITSNQRFKVDNTKNYIIRSLFGSISMGLWFHVVTIIPVTEATSISFLTPLLNVFAGIFILKEDFKKKKIIFLITGFIGAIIMLNPVFNEFNKKYTIALVNVLIWVITDVVTKIYAKKDNPIIQCFYVSLFTSIMCLPFIINKDYSMVNNKEILIILSIGIIQFINLYTVIKAYSLSDLSIIIPFDFTRLIFVSVIAFYLFDESLKPNFYTGSVMILLSLIYLNKNKKLY